MKLFTDFLKSLFKKKTLIYTAFGNEDYCPSAGRDNNYFTNKLQQYDIYVPEEEVGKAMKAMHS